MKRYIDDHTTARIQTIIPLMIKHFLEPIAPRPFRRHQWIMVPAIKYAIDYPGSEDDHSEAQCVNDKLVPKHWQPKYFSYDI